MATALEVSELRKVFCTGRPAVDGVSFHVAGRRDRGAARPFRLRQDHHAALRGRAGASDGRARSASAGGWSRRPPSGVQVPPRLRNIGMVFQSYAVWPHMTVRQNVAYPLRTVASSARRARAQDRRSAGAGRAVGICRPSGGVALGRADAARGAGAQPRLRAAAPAARRAAVQSRRQAAAAAARRPAPHHQADRGDGALRHARPGGGGGAGRPHRRHARRQAAADGVRRTRFTIVRPICSSPISPAHRTCSTGRVVERNGEFGIIEAGRPASYGLAAARRQGRRSRQDRGAAGERAARRALRRRRPTIASPLASPGSVIRARRPFTSLRCWAAGSMRSSLAPACAIRSAATWRSCSRPTMCWAYAAGDDARLA